MDSALSPAIVSADNNTHGGIAMPDCESVEEKYKTQVKEMGRRILRFIGF